MHRYPRRKNNPRFIAFAVTLLWCAAGIEAAAADTLKTSAVHHLFDLTNAVGPLSLPSDVAVGRNGRIYIVDGGNHRIVAFDRSGRHLFNIGKIGKERGEFRDPVGIGTDPNGWIYVADRGNHRIQVFDENGQFQRGFAVKSGGKPVHPIDIAVDPLADRAYVTGSNHKIMVYTVHGRFLREWGGEGIGDSQFRYPATIAVSDEGLVHVVDVMNTRVQVFDKNGKLVVHVGQWGVLPGQLFRPKGVATDRRGWVYVTDSYMDLIQVFDADRRFHHVLGQGGKPQKFVSPGGIAVDDGKRLYVAEMLKHKVSVYALE